MSRLTTPSNASPPWEPSTRLVVGVLLLLGGLLAVYTLRSVLPPILAALVVAYLLYPVVGRLCRWTRLPRWLVVSLVFLVLLVLVAGATTGLGFAATTQTSDLVQAVLSLADQLPGELERLANTTVAFGPFTLDLATLNLRPLLTALGSTLQPVLQQTGNFMADLVGTTARLVTQTLFALVLAFYLLLDYRVVDRFVMAVAPLHYRSDIQRLLQQTVQAWHAFLRGQVLLGLVVGLATTAVLGILGLRFALGLGVIAGVLEFIPIFGPVIATALAVLVALFQSSNWWGLAPWAFTLAVLLSGVVIQQVENHVLVPRIMSRNLNMHPVAVLIAVLAGGSLLGLLGVLLAAPTLATLRIWVGYLYRKAAGLEAWPPPLSEATEPPAPRRPGRWSLGRRKPRGRDESPDAGAKHA
jgi:predicted PurR-regulated permease PerM